MAAALNPPVGQLTAVGIGKETVPGTAVVPSIFHAHLGWNAADKNAMVPRLAARKRTGMTYPATGVYNGKGSLEVEADPDTLPQLIAFALGAQTAPAAVSTSTVAKTSTLTLSNPLPSFTLQVNRVTDAVAYFGCKVSAMALSMSERSGLTAKFTIDYIGCVLVSAAAVTYSTKYPFQFHNPSSIFKYKSAQIGLSGQQAVISFDINVANNLIDTYYSFGNGRFKLALPEQQRSVTFKGAFGFETNAMVLDFFGGATGPGTSIPGVSLEALINSTDYADPGALLIPYSLDLLLPNVFIESGTPDIKPNGIIEVPLVGQASESSAGAQDDLKVTYVNTNTVIY